MAGANTAIRVTELDYNAIRTQLKQFLQNQTVFTDYNFEGSAMSILLDILAGDTYHKAFYTNMLFAESFIDSAILRQSVVSRAKELDYVPRSTKGASAIVQVTISPGDSPAFVTIARGTRIRGLLDGNQYVFSTRQAYTVNPVNNIYQANVTFYEGDPIQQTKTVGEYTGTYQIEIDNNNVDTDTIRVEVKPSAASSDRKEWFKATSIIDIKANSEIWFLEENLNGKYQIQFGDNILGKAPSAGNQIIVSYNAVNADVPNGLRTFSIIDNMGGYSTFSLSTQQPAAGGQVKETAASIKFNAPKSFTAQNRAVTELDYQQFVLNSFGDIQALAVWGGEENEPPSYGKVFISIKPFDGFTLADSRKEEIKKSLRSVNVFSIDPAFVDPTFIYIVPEIEVIYDSALTVLTASTILEKIRTSISNFETNNLGTFNREFISSKFTTSIDDTDVSIVGNDTFLKIQKRFLPRFNVNSSYEIKFNQPIFHPFDGYARSLSSNAFKLPNYSQNIYLDEDGWGNIRAYYFSIGKTKVYVNNHIGTINYTTGSIKLNQFNPTSIVDDNELYITVVPDSSIISPIRNEILLITGAVIRMFEKSSGELITSGSTTTLGDSISLNEQPFILS